MDRSPDARRKRTGSVFSQVHYEGLIQLIRMRGKEPPRVFVDVMCELLAKDNPKFKADLFRSQIDESWL